MALSVALRDLIHDRMDQLGIRGPTALSHRCGGTDVLNPMTASRILSGEQATVRISTLLALATGLDMDGDKLVAIAAQMAGIGDEPWTLPEKFNAVPVSMRPGIERAMWDLLQVFGVELDDGEGAPTVDID